MSEARWLSDQDQQVWRTYLLATRLLWGQLERDLQQGADLPLTYYEVLSALSEAPRHALRMNQLAQALQVSPSRLSHAVSRLEEQGLVRREVCPSDRRGWSAVLTERGHESLRQAAPFHVESVRRHLLDQLTPQQIEQLGEISGVLLAHLAPRAFQEPCEAGEHDSALCEEARAG